MQKKISFKNSKGQRLVGVLHIPSPRSTSSRVEAGKGKGPFPAVIVQHGFKSNHEKNFTKAISVSLEKKGFIVLRFTLSGHRPSSGSYKDVLVSQFIKDVRLAIKFLLKQPRVNRHRLGMVGHSMGAFTALMCANKLHKHIRSVVSIASPYDINAVIKSYQRDKKIDEIGRDYWIISGFKVTKKHYLDRLYLKRKYLISDIHCPVLVIHGNKDKRVNVKDGHLIYQLLNQPKELQIIKSADHSFHNPVHLLKAANLTAAWFKKYLAFKESRVVNAILECQGKILLLKRDDKVATHWGLWSPVGGYLEDGHTPLEQARKEAREELGINPKVLGNYRLGKNFVIREKSIDRVWRVYPVLFRLKKMPRVKLDWENVAYRWVKPLEIKKIKTVEFRIWNLLKGFKLINNSTDSSRMAHG